MNLMNFFGNEGGIELVLDILENGTMDDTLNIHVMGSLATLISLPANIYHKLVMEDFGARIVKVSNVFLGPAGDDTRGI